MNDRHKFLTTLYVLFDIVLILVAFGLSTASMARHQHGVSLKQFLSIRTTLSNFVIFSIMIICCHVALRFCGMYRSTRLSSIESALMTAVRATTLSTVSIGILSLAFTIQMMPLRFLCYFWVYFAGILIASRSAVRLVASYLRLHGRNLRYLLIIGTNARAVEFANRVLANKELGYRLIGFVDDGSSNRSKLQASGFSIVSSYAGLPDYLRNNVVDEVAMYLPLSDFFRNFFDVATLCEQHGILLRFNADVFSLNIARWRTELFDGDHYIATYAGSTHGWPQVVKRLIDIVVSATLLLFLLPVLIATAIAIKISSPGPVLFLQDRIGLNKRRFKIYKFRTMVPGADKLIDGLLKMNETDGPTFKMKSDPRITPIGRFLRKSSLDELPQLLNVLKGDMSLVGPRPLPVRDYRGFNEDWQRRRFSIKPGITCLWQINGRSGISFNQWMILDLQYLDEWSLWLDMKILLRTVPAVLKGSGAA